MQVVVTGANGKVGTAAVAALQAAGHDVLATDTVRGVFERPEPDAPRYWQADLVDAGDAFAVVRGADAVVHAAAIPDPSHNPPHVVFHNNTMAAFNVIEAAVRWGVTRLVNISSETVPGFLFPERPDRPDYVPVDEDHPVRPQDPYAVSKHIGEVLCDAAVQHAGTYEHNLGPMIRDPEPSANVWSYIDVDDLADAIVLAIGSDLPGHEVMYIAAEDNSAGRPLRELSAAHLDVAVEVRELPREDGGGISTAKARRLLGWTASRSWRDHLDDSGHRRD